MFGNLPAMRHVVLPTPENLWNPPLCNAPCTSLWRAHVKNKLWLQRRIGVRATHKMSLISEVVISSLVIVSEPVGRITCDFPRLSMLPKFHKSADPISPKGDRMRILPLRISLVKLQLHHWKPLTCLRRRPSHRLPSQTSYVWCLGSLTQFHQVVLHGFPFTGCKS